MTILFIHAWGGSGKGHWQDILAKKLAKAGHKVLFPSFPSPDKPHLKEWLATLEEVLKDVDPADLRVATHSLGGALWLHFMKKKIAFCPQKVLLVSPPLTDCGIPEIKDFFPLPDIDLGEARKNHLLIYSDNDNYITLQEFETLAKKYSLPTHFVPHAGHINIASGFGDWEWMEKELTKNILEIHGADFFINTPEEFLIRKKGCDAVKEIRKLRD